MTDRIENDPPFVWRDELSDAWFRFAYEQLAERGYRAWADKKLRSLQEDDRPGEPKSESKSQAGYTSKINDRILNGLSYTCWKALADYVVERQLLGIKRKAREGEDQVVNRAEKALCRGIGIDLENVARWELRQTRMDGEKVLGAIALALKKNIQAIPFAPFDSLVGSSIRRTIGLIREAECGGSFAKIGDDDLRIVALISLHGKSEKLIEEIGRGLEEQIFCDVLDAMNEGGWPIASVREVGRAYRDWFLPYLFFQAGMPCPLEAFDGFAAR